MGAISSAIGLITGFPIQETVSKLVSLDAGPMDQLQTEDTNLQAQQTAFTALSADLLALEATTNGFDSPSLYTAQNLTSSNSNALTAAAVSGSSVTPGNYSFTPIQTAQAEELTSSGLASETTALGGGSISIGYGGSVNNPVDLDLLNGGAGFTPGEIRITDRSGASTVINLSNARNINDVLQAINSNTNIDVTAVADGDSIKLIDNTGSSASNLEISEVNGGTTAASLGLAGIDAASSTATGSSILSLFGALPVSVLNNGTGVRFDNSLSDLKINFQDGTSTTVDFSSLPTPGTQARGTTLAADGANAALTFTAVNAGTQYGGTTVVFQNSPAITAGHETVSYDSTTNQLTFNIAEGQTTANDIINALKNSPTASALFTATTANGGNGTGIVTNSDIAYLTGPQSTATTPGTLSSNAQIQFTAVNGGSDYDNVSVQFVDNPSITAGQETVAYNDSDPNNKQLVFQVAAGQTTASDIINALNNNPTVSQIFTAKNATGSDGTGLVSTSDTGVTSGGALVDPSAGGVDSTLQDVLNTLNAAAPGKLEASIAPNGQSIQLTDLTTPNDGTFSVSDLNNSQAAVDLGLNTTAVGGVITGSPLLAGLNSSLLRNLNGGQGLGQLGTLDLTDRSGATASVDLSGAQTLQDVIDDVNNAGIGIQASVNTAGNGIQLTDTTGSTSSNLIVADGDSTDTAEKLGLATNAATTSVNSGNLNLESVSENTTLASLNGGQGVAQGFFTITSSTGAQGRVTLGSNQTSIGDVLTEINTLGIGVQAQINAAGNGILLYDTAGGSGTLKVTEGNSTTAANLHLLGTAATTTVNGQSAQAINGSTSTTITLNSTDTLQDLANQINAANLGATATVFSDGSLLNPYHLAITSNVAGLAGQLQVDTSQLGLTLNQSAAPQDALLSVNNTLVSSSTNTFKNILPGATLTVTGTSSTPVTINAAADSTQLVATLEALVNSYNKIQSDLAQFTTSSTSTNSSGVSTTTPGPLASDPTEEGIESQLANLINGIIPGLGSVTSLAQLGITYNQNGTLTFSQSTFSAVYAQDPSAVQSFLSTTTTGLGDQFKSVLQGIAASQNSLISARNNAISNQLTDNQQQITLDQSLLNNEQQMLLTEFYNQETVVAQLKNSLNIVNSIEPLSIINTSSTSATTSSSSTTSGSTGNAFS
ncbi:MAG TPA: flagellar filament capping protein FliD [Pirellulales bacterium]|jgi:flagellar hook-associated protein 2|nr:flagellar filament capping protein FliD [Pirellulales bacterium]